MNPAPSTAPQAPPSPDQQLLNEFRTRYHQYVTKVEGIATTYTDPTVIARLGDDLGQFRQLVEQSHHGVPVILTEVHEGGRGRPKIVIDRNWLEWAYGQKSISAIASFLGVHRCTVRRSLIEYGICEPLSNPFPQDSHEAGSGSAEAEPGTDHSGDGLGADPSLGPRITSYTRPLTDISDAELDLEIQELRARYRRAGVRMMTGLLRGLGIAVAAERVRRSLLRVDPVRRVFDRIRIERRKYQVAGPNALWHHDGQHGMIPYKPDGVSIHNVRIERLWGDVTAQVTSKWRDLFTELELQHGLNINNMDHIILLHQLFLPRINHELQLFASGWNHHKVSTTNRTPSEMFGWDMYVHGIRGAQLARPNEPILTAEELEYYGVDFEALHDASVMDSHEANNDADSEVSSFLGRTPPPNHLNTITVETDDADWPEGLMQDLYRLQVAAGDRTDDRSLIELWCLSVALLETYFQ
ncbi:hypothetical protein FOMPIDRAFT_1132729 [Fomitopsis schrenkii]|uniref:Integrase core domain-containing protein n=1 Tax=Fomitopsis schrenkii TaxID=2126942 RepID=S8F9K8_FOMSC|nr:hypothetical protein FOMPIDRAFT_1132729 [Fomitopsis schrenkii]